MGRIKRYEVEAGLRNLVKAVTVLYGIGTLAVCSARGCIEERRGKRPICGHVEILRRYACGPHAYESRERGKDAGDR